MLRSSKPDIIHETYFFPYRLGGRRARRVLTIYDMIHERFASEFSSMDKTAHYKKLAAARADHVICISESTRRDVIDILGLSLDKTSVIYLGFDLMKNDGDAAKVKQQISEENRLFDLLELLGKLQDSVKGRESSEPDNEGDFSGYDRWMAEMRASVQRSYDLNKGITHQSYYFYNVIFPLFFANIKAAILEYQYKIEQVEDVEEA